MFDLKLSRQLLTRRKRKVQFGDRNANFAIKPGHARDSFDKIYISCFLGVAKIRKNTVLYRFYEVEMRTFWKISYVFRMSQSVWQPHAIHTAPKMMAVPRNGLSKHRRYG